MAETKTVVVQRGASLGTLLTVLFVAAKLLGVIDWSWWLVLAPALLPITLLVTFLAVVVGGAWSIVLVAWLLVKWENRKSKK